MALHPTKDTTVTDAPSQTTQLSVAGGAVAAGHAVVARVGADVLESGGNAMDATVAMVAAACVCEPTLTGFGGGGFLIVGGGRSHPVEPTIVDFFTRQPGLLRRDALAPWEVFELELDGIVLRYGTGPASVAVPGMVRGLAHATRRFGRRTLAANMTPAQLLAQEGVVLTRTQAGEHRMNAPLMARNADGAGIWLSNGRVRGEGDMFRQPQLAVTIEQIAATDGETLYTGELAQQLGRWCDDHAARLSIDDLRAYEVVERAPRSLVVGDVSMFANPTPAMGGDLTIRLLREMLARRAERETVRSLDRRARDAMVATVIADVLRDEDPPRTRPPVHGEEVVVHLHDGPDSPHAVADAMHDRGAAGRLDRSPNTTHVSAIDADGLLAGATTTLGYGAGVFIPGTGIQLNNMLAEYDHTLHRVPGDTVPSMMTPALLFSPRTHVQLGSAGSDRIPTALAQILERMWHGTPLEEAIRAPRFAWDGASLHAEPGFDSGALDEAAAIAPLTEWPARDPYFGTTNGTALRTGKPYAAGDPRREAVGIVV